MGIDKLQSGVSVYLQHRVGAIFGFVLGSLFLAFFTQNQPILNGALGRAYFFWAWGVIMATIPLIIVLSWRDSLVFLILALPFMGGCGALAFVTSPEVFPNVMVLVMLAFVSILALLAKNHRRFRFLDLKARLTPYMFAESLVIFAISWVCASVMQILGAVSGLMTSSPIVTYIILWTLFFAVISTIIGAVRVATHSSITRIQIEKLQ